MKEKEKNGKLIFEGKKTKFHLKNLKSKQKYKCILCGYNQFCSNKIEFKTLEFSESKDFEKEKKIKKPSKKTIEKLKKNDEEFSKSFNFEYLNIRFNTINLKWSILNEKTEKNFNRVKFNIFEIDSKNPKNWSIWSKKKEGNQLKIKYLKPKMKYKILIQVERVDKKIFSIEKEIEFETSEIDENINKSKEIKKIIEMIQKTKPEMKFEDFENLMKGNAMISSEEIIRREIIEFMKSKIDSEIEE